MSEQTPKILFMDDEPSSDVVIHAVARLRDAGFAVDFVETKSETIEAYYLGLNGEQHNVFVLDIDMSHQETDQGGDGVQVLKFFISLHNQTRVILFSGAGTVQHWFQAANAHCYAYVHKLYNDPITGADSIDVLISQVRAATTEKLRAVPFEVIEPPARVLLVGDDHELNGPTLVAIHQALGADWSVDTLTLDTLNTVDLSTYGVLVILQRTFSTRSSERNALAKALAVTPKPQTIVGCDARNECLPSILYIVNLHPFRLIDLTNPQWSIQLQQALSAASKFYGRPETFKAGKDLRRMHAILAEDITEQEDDVDAEDSEAVNDDPTDAGTRS